MECLSSSSSTSSSQNQPSVPSLGQEAGSCQSQPPRKSRKRGIAALLADVTNQPESSGRRLQKDETIAKVSAMVQDLEPRGDAVKGGKARSKALRGQASHPDDTVTCTLYNMYTKDRELLIKGKTILAILYPKMCLGRSRKPLLFK